MAEEIIDGTGTGKKAKVNVRNRLSTSSASYSESRLIAAQDENTFTWTTSAAADTGEFCSYVKCNSTSHRLIIDKVTVNAVLASIFELYEVTGTAAGTIITGKNSVLSSGNPADTSSFGNAEVTGLTEAGRIDLARIPANGRATMELKDIVILGQGSAIGIKYTGSTGIVDTIVTGYFKPIAELR